MKYHYIYPTFKENTDINYKRPLAKVDPPILYFLDYNSSYLYRYFPNTTPIKLLQIIAEERISALTLHEQNGPKNLLLMKPSKFRYSKIKYCLHKYK